MAEMPWTGRDGYNAAEWKSWKVNKKEAGIVKSYKNLTVSLLTDMENSAE